MRVCVQVSEEFQTIVVFECRGMEPVDFDPRVSRYTHGWLLMAQPLAPACAATGWLECQRSRQ